MKTIEFLERLCIYEYSFVKTYLADKRDYPMTNKGRYRHGFLCTVRGTETYHFDDLVFEAVPGSVLYIPKEERYTMTLNSEESEVIAVDFELFGEASRPFLIQFPRETAITALFSRMESEWNRKSAFSACECKALFYQCVAMMIKQRSLFLPSRKRNLITDGVEYLHRQYLRSDFRLEEAAVAAGISYRYFETLFFRQFGSTPKEYVLSLKMQRAKELLLSEKMKTKDVALHLGYADVSHFCKLFLKKTGLTPGEYKRKLALKE